MALGGWYPTFRKEHRASIFRVKHTKNNDFFLDSSNPLNVTLNPLRHLLALLGARPIFHVSRIRFNREAEGTTETSGTHTQRHSLNTVDNIADTTPQTHRRMWASSVMFSVESKLPTCVKAINSLAYGLCEDPLPWACVLTVLSLAGHSWSSRHIGEHWNKRETRTYHFSTKHSEEWCGTLLPTTLNSSSKSQATTTASHQMPCNSSITFRSTLHDPHARVNTS